MSPVTIPDRMSPLRQNLSNSDASHSRAISQYIPPIRGSSKSAPSLLFGSDVFYPSGNGFRRLRTIAATTNR
jgi:hypothetical protein